MVRQYQCKRNAARHYASCTAGALSGAVASCRSGKSIRKSCDAFKVKKSTLSDKLLGKHTKHYGRPTALKKRAEEILAGVLDKKDQAKRKLSDSGSTVDKKMKIDRSSSKSEKSTEKPVIGKLARQKAAEAKGWLFYFQKCII